MRVVRGVDSLGCKSLKRLKNEGLAQFVIASVLLEMRAPEGSEIDGHRRSTWAEIASGRNPAEEFSHGASGNKLCSVVIRNR